MERASAALQSMDYAACEAGCLAALAMAGNARRWSDYARILLPLQESRRQRRMIAVDGTVRLGTQGLDGDPVSWLTRFAPGCIVVTPSHAKEDAAQLHDAARKEKLCVEVLYAVAEGSSWRLAPFRGPLVEVHRPSPDPMWVNRWIGPSGDPNPEGVVDVHSEGISSGAVEWFVDAAEALGDAALASIDDAVSLDETRTALEQCLEGVDTHEILHQRLGDTARALARAEEA